MPSDHYLKHRFRGRRKGKTLTPYRQSLLENDFLNYKIDDLSTFGETINAGQNNWLEIGFGNGEFLSAMCQNHPDIHFIGCEPFINGVAALIASLEKPVENLTLWNDDARLLIDTLPDQSVDRVYLLNPDPWPKAKHVKRRFVQSDSLDDLARILKTNGQFIMSTDVMGLADWMHVNTWNHAQFEWVCVSQDDWLSPPDDWPLDKTRYMKKALGGETIYWLKFRRK